MNSIVKKNIFYYLNIFVTFLFSYKKSKLKDLRIIDVNELNIVRKQVSQSQEIESLSSSQSKERVINKSIIVINYILAAVFVISFITIVISALFIDIKDARAFDIIQNTFSLILGWFGNSLLVYLGAGIDVNKFNIVGEQDSQSQEIESLSSSQSKERVINKSIIVINYILAAVFVISFITIVISALFIDIKDETAFDIIQNTFSLTLGWFGNYLLVYLGEKDDIGKLIVSSPGILSSQDTCGDRPRIVGKRFSVEQVVTLMNEGLSPQEIVDEYDFLDLSEVHAALAYYYSNQEEIEKYLAEEQAEYQKLLTQQ